MKYQVVEIENGNGNYQIEKELNDILQGCSN